MLDVKTDKTAQVRLANKGKFEDGRRRRVSAQLSAKNSHYDSLCLPKSSSKCF